MKAICDKSLKTVTRFRDVCVGECFVVKDELYLKGVFNSTAKPKAINIITGKIIDLDSSIIVTPITAEFHYKY